MKNIGFFLICFLCCLSGVLFGTSKWSERKNISVRVGENATFHIEDVKDIKRVVWFKNENTFLEIFPNKTKEADFLNTSYKSLVCSRNISSITFCNVTKEHGGLYLANVNNSSTMIHLIFYLFIHDEYCKNFTNVTGRKGEGVMLNEAVFTNDSQVLWRRPNGTKILNNDSAFEIYGNGSLYIKHLTSEKYVGNYTAEGRDGPVCHTFILSSSEYCKNTHVTGREGEGVMLNKAVFTNDSQVLWRRPDGTEISHSDSGFEICENGSLHIKHLTEEFVGKYTVEERDGPACHTFVIGISGQRTLRDIGIGLAFGIIFLLLLIYGCKKIKDARCRNQQLRNNEEIIFLEPLNGQIGQLGEVSQ